MLADHLTRKGIAVLRVDDRGVGGSGGNPMTATTADYVDDVSAGIEYLKSRKEIDAADFTPSVAGPGWSSCYKTPDIETSTQGPATGKTSSCR